MVLLAMLLTACSSAPHDGTKTSLIDNALWQESAVEGDPLIEHQPETISCSSGAWGLEDGSLEVETGLCNYLNLSQPSLGEVAAGDSISLVTWHAQLWDEEAAEAHMAVLFEDVIAWQTTIPIPADPGVFDLDFEAPAALAVGASIQLHLHNHGSNTWNFLELAQQL